MTKPEDKRKALGATGVSREDKIEMRYGDLCALIAAKAAERKYKKRAVTIHGKYNDTVIKTTNPERWEGKL